MAALKCNGLIPSTLCLFTAFTFHEPLAPDKSRAQNGNMVDIFTPNQGIVPGTMPKALVKVYR